MGSRASKNVPKREIGNESASLSPFPFHPVTHFSKHTQMILTKDFFNGFRGVASLQKPLRDFGKFCRIREQVTSAIEIRSDANMIHADQIDNMIDMI